MGKRTPIMFTLYEPETGEARAEYAAFIVPFGILETAVEMAGSIDMEQMKAEDIDALAGLVVDFYGRQFTVDDVKKYADVQETVAVMQAIMTRARAAMPQSADPTNRATTRQKE